MKMRAKRRAKLNRAVVGMTGIVMDAFDACPARVRQRLGVRLAKILLEMRRDQ